MEPTEQEQLNNMVRAVIQRMREQIQNESAQPCCITFTYPKTGYEARFVLVNEIGYLQLRTGMREKGSDRLVSHYLVRGDSGALLAWLDREDTVERLLKSYRQLNEDVWQNS